jgi:hypothetical protein
VAARRGCSTWLLDVAARRGGWQGGADSGEEGAPPAPQNFFYSVSNSTQVFKLSEVQKTPAPRRHAAPGEIVKICEIVGRLSGVLSSAPYVE